MRSNLRRSRWHIVSLVLALVMLTLGSFNSISAQSTTCSPVTATITAPFMFDGAGTLCWRSSNLGGQINSWNLASLTVNGVNFANTFAFTTALPPKAADGFWYVSYTGNFPWSHFEATGTGSPPAATATPTRTNTPTGPSPTATRTPTRTNTPTGPSPTATRTATRTNTPTNSPTPIPANIQIVDFAFQPASLAVNVGASVTWRNASTAGTNHTTTSDTAGLWDSGTLAPGQTFTRVFNTAGVFTYHCNIHPNMTGSITVGQVNPTNTPTNTPVGPTNTPTRTPTPPPVGSHLDNPFVGATFYRNVDYVASVNAAADLTGGTLGNQMRQVASFPTFVWMDSIGSVNGTNGSRGLTSHLDAAVAQGANAIGIVVYDLPNRDCSALASNGELLIAQNGLNRYKTEYIDVIFSKINQAKYSGLRIVMVIEPDSLPNLITNVNSFQKCQEAASPSPSTGAYAQGVQYAIGTLRSIPNTYAYIDAAHAAWLGWPNNFNPFVTLMKQIGAGIPGGIGKVDGFITNTANTNVWVEPFMTANQMIGGQPVRSLQGFYDFNDFIDEQPYGTALRNALISGSDGFSSSMGMLLDTSRNGWGGPNRPTGPSTSTDLRTFVLATTIDKRIHKGNWCNQNGAGIGARPQANPAAGYDAFVWVKPPGESDGSSSLIPVGPDNPDGKGFDPMCDPNYHGNSLNGNNFSGALPNAPVSGRFFMAQFQQLVQNAFPPFQ
jgi:cellulose 1,4-beta-cellobiosidase